MLPLINSTETTLQILWDAALAYYILQASVAYTLLALTLTSIFSYISCIIAARTPLPDDTTTIPALAAALVAAVHVMRWYDVPRQARLRVAIGASAVVCALGARWALGRDMGRPVQWVGLGAWPVVDMWFHGERKGEKEMMH